MSLTEAIAMSCEMVGDGPSGRSNMPASVSLVNEYGDKVYDTYIKPNKRVYDYLTYVSSCIKPGHLGQCKSVKAVRQDVAGHIHGCILVGHSVEKQLRVLGLCHPETNIRDTADYSDFQPRRGKPSLRYLAKKYLGVSIENGTHDSLKGARAAMRLYRSVEDDWEDSLLQSESDSKEEYYDEQDSEYYDEQDRESETCESTEELAKLAIYWEMVGASPNGRASKAARVSVVDETGACVYDTYISLTKEVTDYLSYVSRTMPNNLAQGKPQNVVREEVANLINGRILVGHNVYKDLRVVGLGHPKWNIRDTADYPPFQNTDGKSSLKFLAKRYLGMSTEDSSHDSLLDATNIMLLYKKVEGDWEEWLLQSESESEEDCSY